MTVSVAANLDRIRERIAAAAARAGRREEEITLVAVSKTFPASVIREAYAAGIRHFGENRVQEWEGKQPECADLTDATWHLVGHLQSNKARRAAALFHSIDSVDSLTLAEKISQILQESAALPQRGSDEPRRPASLLRNLENTTEDLFAGARVGVFARSVPEDQPPLEVLIEVRLADEEAKSGVTESALPVLAEAIQSLPRIDFRGLMAIPPFTENPEDARPYFRRMRELRDSLETRLGMRLPELSMGMSHDFEVAIEEGATQIRIGTALFGARTPG